MNRNKNKLIEKFGEKKTEKIFQYMEGILEKNKYINLTSVNDRDEFIVKHILDSLSVVDLDEFTKAKKIIDVGTGGGFPGIPLAIAFPEKQFVLLDSLRKRLRVIDELTEYCGICNVNTIHMRAEDAGRSDEYREKFDLCVSRAVAPLILLSEYCIPLVKKGGFFISYKGEKAEKEIEDAHKMIITLGGNINRVEEHILDEDNASGHKLIIIEKEKKTPSLYPRSAAVIKKSLRK